MDNKLATPAEALVCRANLMARRCEGSEESELFMQLAIHLSASLLATREACKERDELNQQVVNLAVENAGLKARTVTVPAKVYIKDMRSNVVRWSQVIDALSEADVAFVRDDGELIAGARETPATDAAIANIQAQGVEEYADKLDLDATFADESGWDGAAKFLRAEATRVREFSAELRKEAGK